MFRFTRLLALASAATFVVGVGTASAAIGPTVSTSYFSAYATSNCSSGYISAAVHITSKKNYLDVTVPNAGLYGPYGGLVTSTGMQGITHPGDPIWAGQMYAWQTVHLGWWAGAPHGGSQVRFYVDTPYTNVVSVPVACGT